jgi:hypothetical protein
LGPYAYELNWRKGSAELAEPLIIDHQPIGDALDVETLRFGIAYPAALQPGAKVVIYRRPSGQLGFRKYAGDEARSFMWRIMKHAWILNPATDEYRCFEEVRGRLRHPSEFILQEGWPTQSTPFAFVTFHGPTPKLVEVLRGSKPRLLDGLGAEGVEALYSGDSLARIRTLIKILSQCSFVTVWMLGPLNPIVLSLDVETWAGEFIEACSADAVKVQIVKAESELPAW